MSLYRRLVVVLISAIGIVLLFAHPASALPLPGKGIVTDAIGSGVNDAFGSMATRLTGWVLDSLNTFTGGIANFLGMASTPGVDAVWFSGPSSPYASVRSIAVTMLLAFFLLGTMTGLLRSDVGGMVRRMIGALPASIFGMIAAPEVTAQLLALTDSLSSAVLANTGGDALHSSQPLALQSKQPLEALDFLFWRCLQSSRPSCCGLSYSFDLHSFTSSLRCPHLPSPQSFGHQLAVCCDAWWNS